MNYFNIYLEGLALMHARRLTGMAVNEGLLYPIFEATIEVMPTMTLKDGILSFNPYTDKT